MTDKITEFSPGRRWRCQRDSSVSFDFVIVCPFPGETRALCKLEALPDQERVFGKLAVEEVNRTRQSYAFNHLRRVAILQPITLDDIASRL